MEFVFQFYDITNVKQKHSPLLCRLSELMSRFQRFENSTKYKVF